MRSGQHPDLATLDPDAVEARALEWLEAAASWQTTDGPAGCKVSSGFPAGTTGRAYRTDVHLPATSDAVATMLADDMVQRLPEWNREFRFGETLAQLRAEPNDRIWLVRVVYATPWPLADREYVYWLRRHDRAEHTVITYQSVAHAPPPPRGTVRATLSGTVHRVTPLPSGSRLEHLLAGDLGGSLPTWVQDHVFASGIVRAQIRDALAQRQMFA